MNDPEGLAPIRAAGRKAAIKTLSVLRNPHPVGTDKYRQWRQGVADIMRSAVASWEREHDRTLERELESSCAEAGATG